MDGRRARRVLGVGNDAGPEEIRRAFRVRVLATHPDHGGDAKALREVLVAAETLRPAPAACVRSAAPALIGARSGVDTYDSSPRPAPRRDFADVLRAATSRLR